MIILQQKIKPAPAHQLNNAEHEKKKNFHRHTHIYISLYLVW